MKNAKFIFRIICLLVVLIQLSLFVCSSASVFISQEIDEIELSWNDSDESDFESLEDISDDLFNYCNADFCSLKIFQEFKSDEKNLTSYYYQSLSNPEIENLFSPPECKI